jgi:Fe-S cluster biogenesis protein NfuA
MAASKEMFDKVNAVIDTLRPYLQDDGGDIELIDVTDDLVVKVQLQGACGSCPYSLMTLKNGVEQAIKREIPEIVEVVGV